MFDSLITYPFNFFLNRSFQFQSWFIRHLLVLAICSYDGLYFKVSSIYKLKSSPSFAWIVVYCMLIFVKPHLNGVIQCIIPILFNHVCRCVNSCFFQVSGAGIVGWYTHSSLNLMFFFIWILYFIVRFGCLD